MTENKNNQVQLDDEQLDEVSGGRLRFDEDTTTDTDAERI